DFSTLCTRIYFDLDLSAHRGHLYGSSQGGIGNTEVQIVNEVIPVALQVLVFLFFYEDEQVPGLPTAGRFVPLARHGQLHAVSDAGRNPHGDNFFFRYESGAIDTGGPAIYGLAGSVTGRTCSGRHHLPQHCVDNPLHLSRSLTG